MDPKQWFSGQRASVASGWKDLGTELTGKFETHPVWLAIAARHPPEKTAAAHDREANSLVHGEPSEKRLPLLSLSWPDCTVTILYRSGTQ